MWWLFFRAKQYAAGINTYSVCDFTVVVAFLFPTHPRAIICDWRWKYAAVVAVAVYCLFLYFLFCYFIQVILCCKTDIGCAFDCSCQKINVQKMALSSLSLKPSHLFAAFSQCISILYVIFATRFFALRRAVICSWCTVFSSVLCVVICCHRKYVLWILWLLKCRQQ